MNKYVNNTGYLNDSPNRFNPFNIIESKNITMNNVNIPLLLRPNKGKARIAMPNSGEYRFPKADFVVETPLFQPGGSFYDKRGVNVNIKNILQSYLKSEALTYSTNDCPEGYVKDAGGNCVEDVGYNPSQFLQKGMPIIPTKNDSGQIIGGTGATPQSFHTDSTVDKKNISNGGMELKRKFGTPNIPAIVGSNLLSFGLATVANNIEQGRQKAFMMKQMNDPLFNGSYSFAQNDYGVDPYEQTGQLRNYQQGGRTPIVTNNLNDSRLKAYNDSLNLYKAYQMQDKLMGTATGKVTLPVSAWNTKELKDARIAKLRKGLEHYGPISENSGTATGYMQMGGNFNPIDYLYGDDENDNKIIKSNGEENKKENIKKNNRITEEDVDQLSLLGLSIEDILNSTNLSMNLSRRRNLNSSKGFRSFSTYKEGRNALENQLNLYKTGKTKVGLKPDSTLLEAMSKYAPFGDGNNNPIAYAEFIAKKAGVNTNTPISQIDTKKWADAIEKVEGNKKGNNPGNLRAFEKGGTYSVDFNTMMNLKKKGIKFKIVE